MYKVRALSDWKFSVMFLSLRFYVKTILGLVTVQKMLFWQILEALNFHCDGYFHNFSYLEGRFSQNQNSEPQWPKWVSRKILKFAHCATGTFWNMKAKVGNTDCNTRGISIIISLLSCSQCGNYGKFLSHFFHKKFMKAMFSLEKSLNNWFHRIFFHWEWIFRFSTLCCLYYL